MFSVGDKVKIKIEGLHEPFVLINLDNDVCPGFNLQDVFEITKVNGYLITITQDPTKDARKYRYVVSTSVLCMIEAVPDLPAPCSCPLDVLMTSGCTCGGV